MKFSFQNIILTLAILFVAGFLSTDKINYSATVRLITSPTTTRTTSWPRRSIEKFSPRGSADTRFDKPPPFDKLRVRFCSRRPHTEPVEVSAFRGIDYRTYRSALATTASKKTFTASFVASLGTSSASLWVMPSIQGLKTSAVGAMREI